MFSSVTPLSRDSVTSDGGGQWRLLGGGNYGEDEVENVRGRTTSGLSGGGFNESYYSDDRAIQSEGSHSGTRLSGLTSLVRATGGTDLEADDEDDDKDMRRENSTVSL